MGKNILKHSLSYIVVASLLVMMGHSSAVANPPVIKKLVVNPSTTQIPVGTKKISIVAKTSGGDGQELRYQWKLNGPGDLEDLKTEQAVYYIPPATIDQENNLATVSVDVWEEGNEGQKATASVVLTLIGVEVNINSHKGDLSQELIGRVIIEKDSTKVEGIKTRFTAELKPGDAIKIGEESPERGENVFVVSRIIDDKNLELDEAYPTEIDEGAPARIFTDQELFVVANGAEDRKVVIDNSGNVGIGTSSPAESLVVRTTGSSRAYIMAGASDTGSAGFVFDASNGDFEGLDYGALFQNNTTLDVTLMNFKSGANLIFGTGANEKVRIDGNGNVGIGTTDPKAQLDVAGTIRGSNVRFKQCAGKSYNCTPRDCLNLCIGSGLRMATYNEVYAWASRGSDHCAYMWMLHAQYPGKPYVGFPMYHNRTTTGCGSIGTGDMPRIVSGEAYDSWDSEERKANCACAGLM